MEHTWGANNGSRVLVIDDDPDIVKLLSTVLGRHGLGVYHACDGTEGLRIADKLNPDLIILDAIMPGIDGWDVCTRLRELNDVPILMLTACATEADMLHGFASGADDYVKKPFSSAELEARVKALLQRNKKSTNSDVTGYRDKVLNIDLEEQVVELNGKALDLSATEYSLLACLARNKGRMIPHSQLLREVWGCEYGNLSTTLLPLYIYYLRRKLENTQHNHQYIQTQWGRGYCFVPLREN